MRYDDDHHPGHDGKAIADDGETYTRPQQSALIRFGKRMRDPVNGWLARQSLVGDRPVLDPARLPKLAELERNWTIVAEELRPLMAERAAIPAFGEGWGLYSEKLAKEMGAYQDPYSDFGRLTTEIWRAIRLVVDTGLHSKGWSEQRAVDYFLANSPIPEAAVKSEVRRYIVMPGQATAYKIGMIRIQELRAEAEEALGEDFDIRAFHDTVLGGGPVPLSILERRVDQWVASVKAR